MEEYGTIKEKASEWHISMRHVQYLCRKGKIHGAVKRAGSWFIPDNVPVPAKNTKANARCYMFVGTKLKIFSSAVALSAAKGFMHVSFKDIAEHVGIRQSTVYHHFKTKQDLLDAMYDFYCYYYTRDRISMQEMEEITQKENLLDIIRHIECEFKDEHCQILSGITQIIFQRIGVDERAKAIAKFLIIEEGINYADDVFSSAISSGRLAPFNTRLMAVFVNIVRVFNLYCRVVEPNPLQDSHKPMPDYELQLYDYALRFLVDLKPQQSILKSRAN